MERSRPPIDIEEWYVTTMEGQIPRVSSAVNTLVESGLGRAIALGKDPPRTVGWILPLKKNQDSHAFIFNNGDILITQAIKRQAPFYATRFLPNEEPFVLLGRSKNPTIEKAVARLRDNNIQFGFHVKLDTQWRFEREKIYDYLKRATRQLDYPDEHKESLVVELLCALNESVFHRRENQPKAHEIFSL